MLYVAWNWERAKTWICIKYCIISIRVWCVRPFGWCSTVPAWPQDSTETEAEEDETREWAWNGTRKSILAPESVRFPANPVLTKNRQWLVGGGNSLLTRTTEICVMALLD